MKYVVFSMAMLAVLPGLVVCGLSRRLLAAAMVVMFLPLLKFDSLALNFISYEFYRGTSRGMEVSFIYIVALTVVLALAFRRKLPKMLPDLGAWLYLAYFAWAVYSACANDNSMVVEGVMAEGVFHDDFFLKGKMLSFFELWKMAMLGLVFRAVYGYLDLTHDPTAVLKGLGIVSIACFLTVVKEHYGGVFQARGVFPHQNSMALFMMLVGPVFFAAYLTWPKSRLRTLFTFAFVCASGALFRTYSRGAMLCYPIACSITAFWGVVRRVSLLKFLRLVPLVAIGTIGILLLLPRIIDRFENAPQQSGDTRKWFAYTAVNIMKHHPVTGVGVNNWSLFVSSHPEEQDGIEFRPNNSTGKNIGIVETIYLLVGAECGYPGLAILLLWFLYYWILAFRLTLKLTGTRWFCIPAGLLGGLTGCYLQSALEWVLKQQINFMLLMTCFALLSWMNKNWRKLKEAERLEIPKA